MGVTAGALGPAPVDGLVAGLRSSPAATPAAELAAASDEVVASEVVGSEAAATVGEAVAEAPASPTAVSRAARERAIAESASAVEAAPPPEDATVVAAEERYAFLLMGYGGGRHEGGYLTDSLMLVIVDPAGPSLTLLSIPRDAWVPMSFDGKSTVYNKVNTAYAFARDQSLHADRLPRYRDAEGAGVFAAETVSRLLGVPIRYHAALDFDGFRGAIDALGGVQVDVPTAFAARYPANDDPSVDSSWTTVRFRAGVQKMNGEAAIRYARARDAIDDSGEGGDFARARRQRLIMQAFKARLLEPSGLLQLPRLLKIGSEHLETDYDLPGAAQVAELLLDWRSVEIHQAALTLENYLDEATGADGAYLLVPRLEDRSWAQVRAVARRLWADPALGTAMARTPITVVNSTGTPGVAGQVAEALARLGYRVAPPLTGATREASRLVDRTGGEAGAVVRALAKDLGAALPVVAEEDAEAEGEGLVLEIGADDAELARLAPPRDAGAPSSRVGVRTFGQWVPEADEPAPSPVPVATRRPAAPARPAPAVPVVAATPIASGTAAAARTPAAEPSRPPPGTAASGLTPSAATPGQGGGAAVERTATPARPTGATPAAGTPSSGATTGSPAPGTAERTPTPAPAARTVSPTGVAAAPSRSATAPAGRDGRGTPGTSGGAGPTATPARATAPATPTPRAAAATVTRATVTPARGQSAQRAGSGRR